MKLYFAKDELKEWVDHVLAFGIYKHFLEDHETLLALLFFFCIAIFTQVLALILSPISFIIALLLSIKIKRS